MKRVLLLLLLSATVPAAMADEDHERARAALERGEILPLSHILEIVEADTPGRVIDLDFDSDDGRYLYELEILDSSGRLLELTLDAATGAIIERDYEDD